MPTSSVQESPLSTPPAHSHHAEAKWSLAKLSSIEVARMHVRVLDRWSCDLTLSLGLLLVLSFGFWFYLWAWQLLRK